LASYWEVRAAAFVLTAVIIVGQTWLSNVLSLRPVWLLPAVSAVLLIGSVTAYWSADKGPKPYLRWFAGGVVAVQVLINVICLLMLVRDVFLGSNLAPLDLLLAGVALWVVNVAVFALAYWEFDGGGPEERAEGNAWQPDLVFPQQQNQQDVGGLAPAHVQRSLDDPEWKPHFYDYIYVSLTAGTAFSPTDAMPYTWKAKLLMGIESTISFSTVAMILARAINIAKG
jgi:hypothetical protein